MQGNIGKTHCYLAAIKPWVCTFFAVLSLCAIASQCQARTADAGVPEPESADGAEISGPVTREGRFSLEIAQARQALDAMEAAAGPSDEQTIGKVMDLARLYRADGQHAKALALYQRAWAARESRFGPEHEITASSLNGVALVYQDLGRYEEAVRLGRRALDIREKILGLDHPDTAASLNNLAGLYRNMGRYDLAQPLYEKAIAVKEKTLGPKHPATATSLNNLALLFKNTGHYQKALPLYERALAITTESAGAQSAIAAIRMQNIAEIYRLLGRYDKAEPLYLKALEIREAVFGPDHPRVAISLNNLARMYENTGKSGLAMPLLQRALEIREKALGPHHAVTAVSLEALADLHYASGQHETALPLYHRALAIRESSLGTRHANTAQSLGDLGRVFQASGQNEEALTYYLRAFSVAEKAGSPEVLWQTQHGLSDLLAKMGKRDAAIILGKDAVNTLQSIRARLAELEKDSQRSYIHNKERVYKQLAELLLEAGRITEARQVLAMFKEEEYFDFIRRSDADNVRTTRVTLSEQEKNWQVEFASLRNQLEQIEVKHDQLRKDARTDMRQTRLDDLAAHDSEIARRAVLAHLANAAIVAGKGPPGGHGQDAANPEAKLLRETLGRLGHGSVLLHYLMNDDKVHIVLTTPDWQVVRESPASGKDLQRQINLFRGMLKYPDHDPKTLTRLLYRALIEPVKADLDRAGAKTLMFSLDGSLRYLPMAALHDGQHYLVQKYALAVHTDAAWSRLGESPRANWSMLGLGLTREIAGFKALPAAREEINGILGAGGMPGKAWFDQDFTGERLKQSLHSEHAVLHISSHFVFNAGTDTDSYLLLGDGSRLSLRDIRESSYDFSRLDLLTLSACETAVSGGKDGNGREVEGLGVLAQRQGAKAVLASLWPVADKSTSVLMQALYRIRQNNPGMTTAEALRQAQLTLMDGEPAPSRKRNGGGATTNAAGATRYAHPFYWAPFILMGNWL